MRKEPCKKVAAFKQFMELINEHEICLLVLAAGWRTINTKKLTVCSVTDRETLASSNEEWSKGKEVVNEMLGVKQSWKMTVSLPPKEGLGKDLMLYNQLGSGQSTLCCPLSL